MKKYLKKIYILLLLFVLSAPYKITLASRASESLRKSGEAAGYEPQNGKPKIEFAEGLGQFATFVVTLMGALFLIFIIYAGYLWGTSRGNEEQVAKAKKIIIWSATGIAIIIAARIIAEFVIISLGKSTGV